MQSLNDDEQKQVLSEVMLDYLKAILEYVQIIPGMQKDIQETNHKLELTQSQINMHEVDIRQIRKRLAM
ncbi:MAG: hypothetical protein JWL89_185 [Candidatus Saccharibacteria bacterium]|nr:hypothetical protein [Candidatus Saccharibacteria bacterium]